MDYLWSPWRYQYISTADRPTGCIFCDKPAANQDDKNFIVYRGKRNFIILNLYPYTSGHLMVVPYEHAASLTELPDETLTEMMLLVRDSERHLREIYRPEGLNAGMNLGKCAGAGIAGHLHMHVLPRWTGDANFMSTIGETRVLPEEIAVTYSKLKRAFHS